MSLVRPETSRDDGEGRELEAGSRASQDEGTRSNVDEDSQQVGEAGQVTVNNQAV